MFEGFYGFKETPFSRTIPTDKLYHGNDSDELIERLKYAARRQLFAVLTGDSGTGKTTTLRRFRDELSAEYTILYLSDSKLTPSGFYRSLLEQLGFESSHIRGVAKRQLHREIEIMKGVHGSLPVAIVDESHLLNREMLEEVRFAGCKPDAQKSCVGHRAFSAQLSNGLTKPAGSDYGRSGGTVGQAETPVLRRHIDTDSVSVLWKRERRQRIDVVCAVGHLDRIQTSEYIGSHMIFAGCDKDIFSEAAVDDIFKFSGGIPRLINKACTCSLMYGAQNHKSIIDDRMVKLVVESELS